MTERDFTELPTLTVEFLPNSHRYFMNRGEERVDATSPTTILGSVIPKGKGYEMWLRRLGFDAADAEMEQGQRRGTAVHQIMQEYCESGTVPHLKASEPGMHPWIRGLASWLVEASPEPLLVEQTVASWDLRLAGRFDLLAMIEGQPTICDLKTRNKPATYERDHLQIACYKHLLAETFPDQPETQGLIVVVDGEGEVKTEPCLATWEHFAPLLSAFRSVKAVRDAMRTRESGLVAA